MCSSCGLVTHIACSVLNLLFRPHLFSESNQNFTNEKSIFCSIKRAVYMTGTKWNGPVKKWRDTHNFCEEMRVLFCLWTHSGYIVSQPFKDGAYYGYCAYVLRIARYSGFLWVLHTNTGIFLRGLKLYGEGRT